MLAIFGLMSSSLLTIFLPQNPVSDIKFVEHYHMLFYCVAIALTLDPLPAASFFWTAGLPPFVQEFFQNTPFDLGSSKITFSLPIGVFLTLFVGFLMIFKDVSIPGRSDQ